MVHSFVLSSRLHTHTHTRTHTPQPFSGLIRFVLQRLIRTYTAIKSPSASDRLEAILIRQFDKVRMLFVSVSVSLRD
jgi:hypothetical protein